MGRHGGGDPGGKLTFEVASEAPDCTVPTVFDDRDGDAKPDVGPHGHPVEPFGLRIEWVPA